MPTFSLTPKQVEANALLASPAPHIMLAGGSRSGKTFILIRAICVRAFKAPDSRHAVLRFRYGHIKSSIVLDTFPKVMKSCFPDVKYELNRSDLYAIMDGDSEIWFGGLDDKERTEKVLGNEYATIMLNECSQIPYSSRNIAVTRLAQNVLQRELKDTAGNVVKPVRPLPLKMYYDENPPDKGHWTYKLFKAHQDPETKKPLPDPENYAFMQLNPRDNLANLPAEYLKTLESLPVRLRKRFLDGEFRDAAPNALFTDETIDKWRVIDQGMPEMMRIVIAVDPSGSGDDENQDNDEIGIIVCGLGTDGNGYVLEDLTCKVGPAKWGKIATDAFERHAANVVVAEINFGGAMVKHVIQTARRGTPFKEVRASRGKSVRAEPISSLCEEGKVRMAGTFTLLEDELCGFTTHGYMGTQSPNRADAMIWGMSELFPGILGIRDQKPAQTNEPAPAPRNDGLGWMA